LFSIAEKYGTESYEPLIEAIADVRKKKGRDGVIRFNVTGDYLDDEGNVDHEYIEVTNLARGMVVLSYTHAWRQMDPTWFHATTRPNASCDTLADVAVARDAGWSATIVDPDPGWDGFSAKAGFIDCLYDQNGMQCVKCQVCGTPNRKSVVVFPVHGAKKRAAAEAIRAVSTPV